MKCSCIQLILHSQRCHSSLTSDVRPSSLMTSSDWAWDLKFNTESQLDVGIGQAVRILIRRGCWLHYGMCRIQLFWSLLIWPIQESRYLCCYAFKHSIFSFFILYYFIYIFTYFYVVCEIRISHTGSHKICKQASMRTIPLALLLFKRWIKCK